MEFRIGLVPRPLRSVTKGSPRMWRHAALTEMTREEAEARKKSSPQAGDAAPGETESAGSSSIPQTVAAARSAAAPVATAPLAARAQNVSPAADSFAIRHRARPAHAYDAAALSLARTFAEILQHWRKCPDSSCRRHHRCTSIKLQCQNLPLRARSPGREAASLKQLQRALKMPRTAKTKR